MIIENCVITLPRYSHVADGAEEDSGGAYALFDDAQELVDDWADVAHRFWLEHNQTQKCLCPNCMAFNRLLNP